MIHKASGARVAFDAARIRESVLRAGGSHDDVDAVLAACTRAQTAAMTTGDVYRIVRQVLTERAPHVACRYGLRSALQQLGPAGFYFEQYLAALLARTGYRTELPEEFQGGCVRHEVDVVAHKDGKAYAIEAKFRNALGDPSTGSGRSMVHVKDVLASYARYLDLLDGAALGKCPRFDAFWIVTNGKFSERAARFGTCKRMPLIGWSFPTHASGLASMIDRTGLYPVTVLGITKEELAASARAGMLLCDDLIRHEAADVAHRLDISQSRAMELIELAGAVCERT